ncbi:hypothetical protein FIS3754_39160 [Fischerella sp. NIES-3754]|nr:hypothetical protein FIS3754_39160 [Fischerella sp. NIES-3754]BCX10331.1 MAG: hypothetical protein KatS3mg066_4190 [Fischerella sp.]
MLFRLWRSRYVLFTVIGCFVLLLTMSFGVRDLAQDG